MSDSNDYIEYDKYINIDDIYAKNWKDFENGNVPDINKKYWLSTIDILKKLRVDAMENLLLSIYEKLFLFTFQKDHQYEMFAWTIDDLSFYISLAFEYPSEYNDKFCFDFEKHVEEYIKVIDEIYGFNQDNIDKVYEIAKRNYGYYIGTEYMDDCGLDLDALRTYPELLSHMAFFNYFKRFIPDWR